MMHYLLWTPLTYVTSPGGVPKPCTVVAFIGEQGQGKTTFLRTVLSSLAGSTFSPYRCGSGLESQVSTVNCMLIPVHKILWPQVKECDLPCYFYIWDTRGLSPSDQITGTTLPALLNPILRGTLRNSGSSLMDVGESHEHPTPAAQAVFYFKSAKDLCNEDSCASMKEINAYCQSRNPGMPVYVIATKSELAIDGMCDPQEGVDQYSHLLTNPKVNKLLRLVSKNCGIDFGRCYLSFGLDSIRCTGISHLLDVRESLLLTTLKNAIAEVYLLETMKSSEEHSTYYRNRPQSLLYCSTEELAAMLSVLGSEVENVIKENNIDGFCLFRMTKEEIRKVFHELPFGTVDRILRMVEPYWCQTKEARPSMFREMTKHMSLYGKK